MTAWIKRGTKEHVGIVADDFVDPESVSPLGLSRYHTRPTHAHLPVQLDAVQQGPGRSLSRYPVGGYEVRVRVQ